MAERAVPADPAVELCASGATGRLLRDRAKRVLHLLAGGQVRVWRPGDVVGARGGEGHRHVHVEAAARAA